VERSTTEALSNFSGGGRYKDGWQHGPEATGSWEAVAVAEAGLTVDATWYKRGRRGFFSKTVYRDRTHLELPVQGAKGVVIVPGWERTGLVASLWVLTFRKKTLPGFFWQKKGE